jgi:hypothetical protein
MSKVNIIDISPIKEGIKFIDRYGINLDHVPYIKEWKTKIIFIIMVILNCNIFLYENIPIELIKIICYNYLNICKTVCIKSIADENICPCSEQKCLLNWFDMFDDMDSLYNHPDIFHCDTIVDYDDKSRCHSIGWSFQQGGYCSKCDEYRCEWCVKSNDNIYNNKQLCIFSSEDSSFDGDPDYMICKECIDVKYYKIRNK